MVENIHKTTISHNFFLFFFCIPSYISGFHHSWCRFLSTWKCPNLIIEAVTFHLCGWCMLGVFLLSAFTRLGHKCQDLWNLCDGMRVCSDLLTYLCPSLPVEHRPSATPRHRTLFWAALIIPDQLVPCCFSSASVSRLQLLRGRPLFLFPCGFQVRAWRVVLDAGFLRVCPIQPHCAQTRTRFILLCNRVLVNGVFFVVFFCVPQLYLWGSPLLGEIFAYVPVF